MLGVAIFSLAHLIPIDQLNDEEYPYDDWPDKTGVETCWHPPPVPCSEAGKNAHQKEIVDEGHRRKTNAAENNELVKFIAEFPKRADEFENGKHEQEEKQQPKKKQEELSPDRCHFRADVIIVTPGITNIPPAKISKER